MIQLAKSIPSFKEWRTKKPVIMPDRGFTKQLKILDPGLEVKWDWGLDRWEIWDVPKDGSPSYHVLTVQTKNKSYRELGTDILLSLQKSISWQNLSAKQICDYLDELDNQRRRRKARDFKNQIDAITNETFNYARGVLQLQVPRKFSIANAVKEK